MSRQRKAPLKQIKKEQNRSEKSIPRLDSEKSNQQKKQNPNKNNNKKQEKTSKSKDFRREKLKASQKIAQNTKQTKRSTNKLTETSEPKSKEKPNQKDKKLGNNILARNEQSPEQNRRKMDFTYLKKHGIQIISRIGKGGYGLVYKALWNKRVLAIKINYQTVSFKTQSGQLGILKLIQNSEHLCQLIEILHADQKMHIITQHVEHHHYCNYFYTMTPLQVKHYMFNLLKGLQQLKSHGIIHLDLKPSNFLYNTVTKKGVIIDFGVSEISQSFVDELINSQKKSSKNVHLILALLKNQQKRGKRIGTNGYNALEVILKQNFSYSADMWSAGVIFLQFLVKKVNIFSKFIINKNLTPLNSFICCYLIELGQMYGSEVIRMCKKYGYKLQMPFQSNDFSFDKIICREEYGDDCINLVSRMMVLAPEERISVQDALNHQYFYEIKKR